jgi:thioredoxin reductase
MADFKVTQLQSGLDFENLAHWDVVIVGAGPAGLAASPATAHRALTTLVIEAKDRPGGQPQFLYADKWIVDKETFERLALVLNEDGSIAVELYFETSRQGIFAVGDVHGDIKLIAVAWAEGIQAAIHAFKEITSPYWLNEKRLKDHKIALIGEKIARAASRVRPAP